LSNQVLLLSLTKIQGLMGFAVKVHKLLAISNHFIKIQCFKTSNNFP